MPRHRARRWRRHWDRVAPSFALPEAVRRIVYTTDATRALSSKPRRAVRARGHFPSDEAATKLPCLVLSRAAEDRKRPPREWLKAKTQPAIVAGRALQSLLNVISLAHRSPDSPRFFPLELQTTYRDLLGRHLRRPSPEIAGSVMRVSKGGAGYRVVRRRVGARVVERHLGADTAEVRRNAEAIRRQNEALRAWSRDAGGLVAQLRAARLPTPTTGTGKLVLALERAGFFRQGGVVAGTPAFGLYALELGVRLEHVLAQTEDVDVAADRGVGVIAGERTSLTSSLDGLGLRPVAGSMEARPVRWETEDGVVLDILTPRRRGGEPAVMHHGLGVWAQALPSLEFSLRSPVDAVVLGREGILVRVPAPERYAVHKLIVASAHTGSRRAKSAKDLAQAAVLVRALAEAPPFELTAAYEDAISRGPNRRRAIETSLARRPDVEGLLRDAESCPTCQASRQTGPACCLIRERYRALRPHLAPEPLLLDRAGASAPSPRAGSSSSPAPPAMPYQPLRGAQVDIREPLGVPLLEPGQHGDRRRLGLRLEPRLDLGMVGVEHRGALRDRLCPATGAAKDRAALAALLGTRDAGREVGDDGRLPRGRRGAALVDAAAQLGLRRPDRRKRDHGVGPSSQLGDARHALRGEPTRGQSPIGRRGRWVPALRHPGAEPRLLAQLERRLEQVGVQPGRRVEPGQRLGRGHALEPTVAHEAPDDRAVLLLDPGLVVLAGQARERVTSRPRARHHATTGSFMNAPSLSKSTPLRGKGKEPPRRLQRLQREGAHPHQHRHALGPARGDVGQHQRLNEGAGRAHSRVGHEVHFDEARRRITPAREGAHRHRTTHRRAEAGPSPAPPAPPRCASPTAAGRSSRG